MVTIHSSEQFAFSHIEGIILGASEEIDEVAGEACDRDVDRIGDIGDRASEDHTAGMYGIGFTAGSLARVAARDRMDGLGIEIGSDKELTEDRRMVICD